MAHIVIDARHINSSTGTYIERLLHSLEQIDQTNRYTVVTLSKDVGYWTPTNKNFSVISCDSPIYSLSEQMHFKKFLDGLKPDLVHFCMPQQPVFYKGNKVTTFHDLILLKTYNSDKNWLVYRFKQLVGRFVFASVVKTSFGIIAPTKFVKDDIVKTFGTSSDKITVTYEAADKTPAGKTEVYQHPYGAFIMYVGVQSDYKNIRRLGDAHQVLLEKYPNLGLILVGNLNKAAQNNKNYFDKKGYKNITFTGYLSNEQRDWLYANTHAYVFPSLMEGFGLPGLEAMLHGAPVVSSNATCLPEVYGKAAHYFDPTNVDDMVRAIDEVLGDEALRDKLIAAGNKQVKLYSWERTARQTHEVYMRALDASSE